MAAAESGRREERQLERRAEPARRTSRLIYPKTAARGLHQSSPAGQNQNPQNGHLLARFDWGVGAACFGASPVAAVFGSAPGSATSPKHRIQFNPAPPGPLSKQDISTLLGIGHFYFALTAGEGEGRMAPPLVRLYLERVTQAQLNVALAALGRDHAEVAGGRVGFNAAPVRVVSICMRSTVLPTVADSVLICATAASTDTDSLMAPTARSKLKHLRGRPRNSDTSGSAGCHPVPVAPVYLL